MQSVSTRDQATQARVVVAAAQPPSKQVLAFSAAKTLEFLLSLWAREIYQPDSYLQTASQPGSSCILYITPAELLLWLRGCFGSDGSEYRQCGAAELLPHLELRTEVVLEMGAESAPQWRELKQELQELTASGCHLQHEGSVLQPLLRICLYGLAASEGKKVPMQPSFRQELIYERKNPAQWSGLIGTLYGLHPSATVVPRLPDLCPLSSTVPVTRTDRLFTSCCVEEEEDDPMEELVEGTSDFMAGGVSNRVTMTSLGADLRGAEEAKKLTRTMKVRDPDGSLRAAAKKVIEGMATDSEVWRVKRNLLVKMFSLVGTVELLPEDQDGLSSSTPEEWRLEEIRKTMQDPYFVGWQRAATSGSVVAVTLN